MSRAECGDKNLADLDKLIGEITADAYSDDEKLWAFRQAFADNVTLPLDGFVIGEPVSLIEISYEAGRIFEKMLWLNPSDHQGVRFLIEAVRARQAWEENQDNR